MTSFTVRSKEKCIIHVYVQPVSKASNYNAFTKIKCTMQRPFNSMHKIEI